MAPFAWITVVDELSPFWILQDPPIFFQDHISNSLWCQNTVWLFVPLQRADLSSVGLQFSPLPQLEFTSQVSACWHLNSYCYTSALYAKLREFCSSLYHLGLLLSIYSTNPVTTQEKCPIHPGFSLATSYASSQRLAYSARPSEAASLLSHIVLLCLVKGHSFAQPPACLHASEAYILHFLRISLR